MSLLSPFSDLIEPVAIALWGPPKRSRHNPNELRWGTNGRFSVRLDKGIWIDHHTREGGGVLDLIRREIGGDRRDAVRWLKSHGHHVVDDDRRPVRPVKPERPAPGGDDDAAKLLFAKRIWREAGEFTDAAHDYYAKRGIPIDEVPEHGGLRFHPNCLVLGERHPCIIGLFTDAVTGDPRAILRRPIDGGKPKSLGPSTGCVIRLWPDDAVTTGLVLGEGVETVLAAATRIQHRGTLLRPAWATGGTATMAAFPVLPGIESLTILVDHDSSGAGEDAATACAERWRAAGREVIRLVPKALGDFNDVVRP